MILYCLLIGMSTCCYFSSVICQTAVDWDILGTRALGSRDHDHDPFLTIEARSAIIYYRGIELEIAIVFLLKISIFFEKVN